MLPRRSIVTAVLLVLLAVLGAECGNSSPTSPAAPRVGPTAVASVVSTGQDPIAAVTSVQFDGTKSTSSATGGITGYSWNFGDGSTATGVSVQHTYNTTGVKTATLTVTDANGTSAPATIAVTIKDLTGTWRAQFNVQTRTYTLTQTGTQLTGTYTNTYLLGQTWTVNGVVDASRRLSITATYSEGGSTSAHVLSNATIDATVSSFTGVTVGGSADGQVLTYSRVQ